MLAGLDDFKTWIEQFLMSKLGHGDMVVVDNLRSHKVVGIHKAIGGGGTGELPAAL